MNTLWTPQALTLDLDDTLWPIWPTIARAEQALQDWLRQHAPRTALDHAALDAATKATRRAQLVRERPD